ncbi:hypothetical protein A3B35_00790 [Candidatus Kaiserbacteria bacterium RIFCSPLOWO2_01_FULL_54_24]|uniref:Uncharacterized protein n=1 Tax=Candidatus Kaiserbacteria bacterium RIFCSPLOWO2_01_FULL_54_24 TaxID=1798515 RepID=A0A1F6EU09_9BACT|nr:MAG: hypothetical protein A3B35_00790 [Candidatus Kaiserbacteria bacterium RIFCSPLOWO2_01_FULL_54_24]
MVEDIAKSQAQYERLVQQSLQKLQAAPASALTMTDLRATAQERIAAIDSLRKLDLPPAVKKARLAEVGQLPGEAVEFFSLPQMVDVFNRSGMVSREDTDALAEPINERMNILNSLKMPDGKPTAGWISIRLIKREQGGFIPYYDVYPVFLANVAREEQERIISQYEDELRLRGLSPGPQLLRDN